MMNYELQTWIDELDGSTVGRIIATDAEGKQINIPLDPNNSDYAQYLAFTAWVDAGNDPNEFGQEEI
jgi:hypothetical protein